MRQILSLVLVYTYVSFSICTFTVAIPINDSYVESLGGSARLAAFTSGVTAVVAGALNLPFLAATRVVRIKTILIASMGVSSAGLLMYSFASYARSLEMLLLGRVLNGAVGSPFIGELYERRVQATEEQSVMLALLLSFAITLGYFSGGVVGGLVAWLARDLDDPVFNTHTASTWLLLGAYLPYMGIVACFVWDVPLNAPTSRTYRIRTDAAVQFALLVVVESMQTTAMGTWEGVALWRFRTWGWSRELASVYWGILLSTAFPLALVYPPRTRNRHRVVLLSCASTAGSMLQLGSSDRVADVVLFTLGSVLQLASSQISRGYLWGRLIALSETSTFPRTLQAISCVVYGTSVGGGLLLSGWIEDRYAYATVNVALGVTALLLCTFVSETHLSYKLRMA